MRRCAINRLTTALPDSPQRVWGMTLIELMIVVAILGLLAAVAVPSYQGHIYKKEVAETKKDILAMSTEIEIFRSVNRQMPVDLAEAGFAGATDPWGNPYRFSDLKIGNNDQNARLDGNLLPLNSDYDLYSVGKDGVSKRAVSDPISHDDILRIHDGHSIVLADDLL